MCRWCQLHKYFGVGCLTDLPSHGAVVNFICKNAFLEGGENCTLYQFKYSRVMPLREVDDILKTRNWNLYFGTEMKLDVCLATQKIDKTFDAIYPYNRVPVNTSCKYNFLPPNNKLIKTK